MRNVVLHPRKRIDASRRAHFVAPSDPNYQRYEFEKLQWANAHPAATPAEYSAAMREIARRCGV